MASPTSLQQQRCENQININRTNQTTNHKQFFYVMTHAHATYQRKQLDPVVMMMRWPWTTPPRASLPLALLFGLHCRRSALKFRMTGTGRGWATAGRSGMGRVRQRHRSWMAFQRRRGHCVGVGTGREQIFDPRLKWTLVPEFFAPGTRDTFSPGWWLQPGLKIVMEYWVKKEGLNKDRIFYKCPDRSVSYFIVFNDYG